MNTANFEPTRNEIKDQEITNETSLASKSAFEELDPQALQKWSLLFQEFSQLFLQIEEASNLRLMRNRQQIQKSIQRRKEMIENMYKRQREVTREISQMKKPKLSLFQRIAAFVKRKIEGENPQLPKGMYSVENVQKERQQRGKPLKKGYYIRSKKPINTNI